MKVLGPRVAVIIKVVDPTTEDGIFIPQIAANDMYPTDEAEVVGVGTGYYSAGTLVESELSVGDIVVIPKVTPKINVTDKEGRAIVIIPDQEVVAVL
tara:strand:+ start:1770 stop:2060 length:291 start_codon:yes stop_codon:yes gene_type:complete